MNAFEFCKNMFPMEKFKFIKRSHAEREALRSQFKSARKKFIRHLAKMGPEKLKNKGLSERAIKSIMRGESPQGYDVHHKRPLNDSGSNDVPNLVLIKKRPHTKIHVVENAQTRGMKPGQSKMVTMPVPRGSISS